MLRPLFLLVLILHFPYLFSLPFSPYFMASSSSLNAPHPLPPLPSSFFFLPVSPFYSLCSLSLSLTPTPFPTPFRLLALIDSPHRLLPLPSPLSLTLLSPTFRLALKLFPTSSLPLSPSSLSLPFLLPLSPFQTPLPSSPTLLSPSS